MKQEERASGSSVARRRPLRVVVLTCGAWGREMAEALDRVRGAVVIAIVFTPPRRVGSLAKRIRRVHRMHGWRGVAEAAWNRMRGMARRAMPRRHRPAFARLIPEAWFGNFHDADCLAALAALDPDIMVIDGTYVLREPVFTIARLATINIHCGKLPEYRGAPPAFWEMYHGERQVGVTVHQVTAGVDQGPIYHQRVFPLETTPARDPVRYAHDIYLTVLRPAGIELMAMTVEEIAAGLNAPTPQLSSPRPTYHMPDRDTMQALRRRVRIRETQEA